VPSPQSMTAECVSSVPASVTGVVTDTVCPGTRRLGADRADRGGRVQDGDQSAALGAAAVLIITVAVTWKGKLAAAFSTYEWPQ